MTQTKLGRRQREVLTMMQRNGGMWPTKWRIRHAQQGVFDSLMMRGLIVQDGNLYRMVIPSDN